MSRPLWKGLAERVRADALLSIFCALAFALTAVYTVTFFQSINSTLSDFTWGDIIWINQAFYNFIHGRALQTSVYCASGEGVVFNPFSYSSQIAMHVNWFPYIFAPLYALRSDVDGLYAISLAWSYIGTGFFTWKTLKFLATDRLRVRFAFMMGLLACGSFFPVFTYKSLFLLFAGPLISALVYFLVSRHKTAFLLTGLLLCLVVEDAALFAACFSVYVFLFHREERDYAPPLFILSMLYVALVILVIMPATKYDLVLASRDSSDIVIRLKKLAAGEYPLCWRCFVPIGCFLAAGWSMLAAFFPPTARTDLRKVAGLTFLAPATHWLITLTQGGGHHPLPVMMSAYGGMTLWAGTGRSENRRVDKAPAVLAAFALGLVLLRGNIRWIRGVLIPPFSYSRLMASSAQAKSNKAVLATAASIPPEASLTYWTNKGLDGFLSNRSDVWRFPRNFDLSDYLLIQKDGELGFFTIKPPFPRDAKSLVDSGVGVITGTSEPNREAAAALERALVTEAGTHVVAAEDEHSLLLRRKEHYAFPMPAFSLGFGWVRNIPKLRTRKVP